MFTCIICNHTCVYTIPSALPSRKTSRLNLNQALNLTFCIDQTSNIQHQHVCKHRKTFVNTNTLNIIKHQSTQYPDFKTYDPTTQWQIHAAEDFAEDHVLPAAAWGFSWEVL